MATEKQIEANRRNALKSPGPSTPEAKAKVRMNAMRDGITGQVITLSEEDRPIFEQLKAELIEDFAPKTTMELRLANSIAWDTWRLDHLRAVEMNLYALGTQDPDCDIECDGPQLHTAMSGALTFVKQSKKMGLLSIYEQRLNRSIHKNMDKLVELQTERKRNYEHDLKERRNGHSKSQRSQRHTLPGAHPAQQKWHCFFNRRNPRRSQSPVHSQCSPRHLRRPETHLFPGRLGAI